VCRNWVMYRKRLAIGLFIATLQFANNVAAEDDWELLLELYGWLPNIEIESETGRKSEITRSDILENLDMAAMAAARVKKGKWALTTDFIYFSVSNNDRAL